MSKEKARCDLWLKDIAPSTDLRKWFGHEEKKWGEFEKQYMQELQTKQVLLSQLKELERTHKKVTLLFSTKDREHINAVILLDVLKR